MRLVFLYGPPGVGKLTIAKFLQERTGARIFHNHLTVDLLTAVFEFGSQPFRQLRESTWLAVFEEAARAGIDVIFTFAPEGTVDDNFAPRVVETVEAAGGEVVFVELSCSDAVLRERMTAPERGEWGKLNSWELYQDLLGSGSLDFEMGVDPGLSIDTGAASADESAAQIADYLEAL